MCCILSNMHLESSIWFLLVSRPVNWSNRWSSSSFRNTAFVFHHRIFNKFTLIMQYIIRSCNFKSFKTEDWREWRNREIISILQLIERRIYLFLCFLFLLLFRFSCVFLFYLFFLSSSVWHQDQRLSCFDSNLVFVFLNRFWKTFKPTFLILNLFFLVSLAGFPAAAGADVVCFLDEDEILFVVVVGHYFCSACRRFLTLSLL